MQSLQTQGEIIAAAVAASATIDTDAITIDPEKLLKLAPGESYSADGGQAATGFSLNPERIGPLLRNLVSRAPARARIYDRDGELLLIRGLWRRIQPAPPKTPHRGRTRRRRHSQSCGAGCADPACRSIRTSAKLTAKPIPKSRRLWAALRNGSCGPTRRARQLFPSQFRCSVSARCAAAFLLSTLGGDIDAIIATEHSAMIRIFLVSAGVLFVISLLFAKSINRQIADVCKT